MFSIGHIFLKDLRRFWVPVTVAFALDVLLGFFPDLGVDASGPTESKAIEIASAVRLLVIGLVAVAAVHEDLVDSDRPAWLTRPIGPLRLLAAKILLLTIALAVPAGVCAMAVSRHYHLGFRVSSAIGLENGSEILLLIVSLACLASMTSSLLAAGMALIAIAVVFSLIQPYLMMVGVSSPDWFTSSGLNVKATMSALVAVLAYQYWCRQSARAVWLAIFAGGLAITIARITAISFLHPTAVLSDVKLEAEDPKGFVGGASERPFPLADKVVIGLQVKTSSADGSSDFIANGQSTFSASNGVTYTMSWPSSSSIMDSTDEQNDFYSVWNTYPKFAWTIGVPLRIRNPVVHNLAVLVLPPDDFERLRGLSGDLAAHFQVWRTTISDQGSLPLQVDAIAEIPGRRVRVESIRLTAGSGAEVAIHTTAVKSRGISTFRLWALVNDKKNEVSLSELESIGHADTYVLRDQEQVFSFRQRWERGSPKAIAGLDTAWLGDARLVFVGTSGLSGSANLSVPNFVMPKTGGLQ